MRICPSCSTENPDDRDFCSSCNTYLRWEPTQYSPSVPSVAQTPAAPAPPGAPEDAATQADPPPAEPEQSRHALQRLPVIKPEGTRQYEAAPSDAPAATAAPPPPAEPPPPEPPPTEPDTVIVTLRLPGEEGAGSASVTTSVAPGAQSVLLALVRNQSGIVDNYDLVIDDMPPEWWTITPSTVYLVPFGAPGGEYEQEVEVRLHPPRSPEAEARPWPVRIVATSKAHERPVGSASADVVIDPYQELETEMRPERASGHRKAKYAIAVRNRANAPTDVAFAAIDSENACEFQFDEPGVTIPPGKRLGTPFVAKPRKTHWFGRPIERRFQVSADPVGAEQPSIPKQGVFRHKPWIPWWVPIVVPILIAVGIAIWLLWPHNTIVPNLKGLKVSAAQTLLAKKGLELGDTKNGDPTGNAKLVGTIETQSKPPNAKVKKGTKINVTVFVGNGLTTVPDLKGKTLNQAKTALDQAKLQMGKTTPAPKNPDKDKVVIQSPAFGGPQVKEGSAVDVFLQLAGSGKGKGNGNGKNGNNGVGKTLKKVGGGQILIPALVGQGFAGVGIAGLRKLGLPIQQTPAISTAAAGTIVGQTPASGTKIDPKQKFPVSVSVSVGFPKIAYDNGTAVFTMNGATGKGIKQIAASGTEPSWQPKGNLIAYESAGKVIEVNPAAGVTSARTLTAGPNDHRPVFSPNGKVVAFIRGPSGNGDLCFVPAIGGTPSCILDPAIDVDRPTWAPDGKAILTTADESTNPHQFELFLYTTAQPFAAQASAWVPQGLQLKPKRAGDDIIFAAWSPDNKRIAFVANWGSSPPTFFKLFLVPWSASSGLGQAKPVSPAVAACTVTWRQDGKEVAIEQTNDCANGSPAVSRVNPDKPQQLVPLQPLNAYNPAWQFFPNLP
jgi:beta-lactam-binding protein with PASTA domain